MQITVNKKGSLLLIGLQGRLDASTPKEFEAKLMGLIEGGETHMVFDLSQVEQVSTAGLRVLLRVFKQATYANGRMVFHSAGERVRRRFEVAGLTMLFRIYGTREEAVAGAMFTGLLPVNILRQSNHHFNQTA